MCAAITPATRGTSGAAKEACSSNVAHIAASTDTQPDNHTAFMAAPATGWPYRRQLPKLLSGYIGKAHSSVVLHANGLSG
jgi:hypothetical protein